MWLSSHSYFYVSFSTLGVQSSSTHLRKSAVGSWDMVCARNEGGRWIKCPIFAAMSYKMKDRLNPSVWFIWICKLFLFPSCWQMMFRVKEFWGWTRWLFCFVLTWKLCWDCYEFRRKHECFCHIWINLSCISSWDKNIFMECWYFKDATWRDFYILDLNEYDYLLFSPFWRYTFLKGVDNLNISKYSPCCLILKSCGNGKRIPD